MFKKKREFQAIPGYHETQVRAAFKARYSKAVEEIAKDTAPTDFRCLFVSTKENFSIRTNQRGSNMQGGTRTVAGAVAGTNTQTGQVQHALLKLIYVHKYVGNILSQLVSSDSQA